jgi:hypothetical protein
MEPADLKTPSPDDRRVDAWLRQPPPELPDAGFSARVLAALPPQKTATPWVPSRTLLCTLALMAGMALAFSRGISSSGTATNPEQWREISANLAPLLTNPWLGLSLAITAASLFMAFGRGGRRALS